MKFVKGVGQQYRALCSETLKWSAWTFLFVGVLQYGFREHVIYAKAIGIMFLVLLFFYAVTGIGDSIVDALSDSDLSKRTKLATSLVAGVLSSGAIMCAMWTIGRAALPQLSQ